MIEELRQRFANVINCRRCGKVFARGLGQLLFSSRMSRLCPVCLEVEEREVDEVQNLLSLRGSMSIAELSEETGIEEGAINWYLREDVIQIPEQTALERPCPRCGKVVEFRGRYCPLCTLEVRSSLSETALALKNRLRIGEGIFRPRRRHGESSEGTVTGARSALRRKRGAGATDEDYGTHGKYNP